MNHFKKLGLLLLRATFVLIASSAAAQTGNGYTYGRAVVIDHRQVQNSDQTDFPVLISGTFPFLATTANGGYIQNASGYDIIFTSDAAGATQLDHEIDSYSATTGTVAFWVRIPTLSHTADTTIYMWYGNSSISVSQENKASVWRNGYAAVWHFGNGSSVNALDSTGVNNGTLVGVSAAQAQIGGAASFSGGTNSYIDIPNNAQIKPASALTVETWANPAQMGNWNTILDIDYRANGTWTAPYQAYVLSSQSPKSQMVFGVTGSSGSLVTLNGSQTIPLSQWTHIAGTYDGATLRMYENGVLDPNTASASGSISYGTSKDLTIGNDSTYQTCCLAPWKGLIDELRISSVARSADWIATEYNNQSSPSSFAFMGPASTAGGQPPAYSLIVPASNFNYYRPVIIDHRQIQNSDQTDFPVLVSGTLPDLATVANGGQVQSGKGYDIMFTSDAAGLNRLDHEIDSYSPTTGNANFWVRIPTLSHATDTTIYMWYGSTAVQASQENRTGVWRNGYAAVWHFGSGGIVNATDSAGSNNGELFGVSALQTGKIGGAVSSSSNHITVPGNAAIKPTSALTLEGWINPSQYSAWSKIFALDYRADGSWNAPYLAYALSGAGNGSQMHMQIANSAGQNIDAYTTGTVPLSQWTHLAGTYDGTALHMYTNGVLDPSSVSVTGPINYGTSKSMNMGTDSIYSSVTDAWYGSFDELRISSVARSSDWIATEYNNQNSPSTFAFFCPSAANGQSTSCSLQIAPSAFSHSVPITIGHQNVPNTDQTDFPMVISGTYSYLATVANGGQVQSSKGYDIVFTSDAAGQTQLDHEIDNYNPITGATAFWVRIPTLSHTTDTTIYMWYGSSAVQASQENKAGVWRNGYAAVWHFGNGNAVNALDSAGGNNGTLAGVSAASTAPIGGAASFAGNSSSFIAVPNNASLKPANALSLEAWVNPAQVGTYNKVFSLDYAANGTWNSPWMAYVLSMQLNVSGMTFGIPGAGVNSTRTVPLSQWSHVVGTYDGSQVRIYLNGTAEPGTTAATGPIQYGTSQALTIGKDSIYEGNYVEGWNGSLDELRVSSVARTADWISTEYNNQSAPSVFATVGSTTYFVISTTALSSIAQYQPYTATLAAAGGTPSFIWSISSGTLPAGLSLNSATGVISGTPTSMGTSTFTVQASDANSNITTRVLSITVNAPAPVITGTTATTGSIGAQVTLTGTGFGPSGIGSQVTLNGAAMTIVSWSNTSVTLTIAAGATSGSMLVKVAPGMNSSNSFVFHVTTQPLPSTWVDQDVGSPTVAGSATYSNGAFTINGSGNVSGSSSPDNTHFVYQALSGDGTIVARVASLPNGYYPQAGVMIRETMDGSAKEVAVEEWTGTDYLSSRSAAGASTSLQSGPNCPSAVCWLKLVRTGNVFTGYISANGLDWWQIGAATTVTMASHVYVGIFAGNSQPWIVETAVFDNVSVASASLTPAVITAVSATTGSVGSQLTVTGSGFGATQNGSQVLLNDAAMTVNSWSDTSITFTVPSGATSGWLGVALAPTMDAALNPVPFTITSQPLPGPWLDRDLGFPSVAGSATYSGGVFTIIGGGQLGANSGTTDHGHFMYQSLSGDGSITARVTSYQSTTSQQVALMVRETLNYGAAAAFLEYVPNISYFADRPATGSGLTGQQGSGPSTSVYWMKLIRDGNTFIAEIGSDGGNWIQIGNPVTVPMAANVEIGIAVATGGAGGTETATFDNVSVTNGTTPYISGVSPSTAGVGVSITISGSNFGVTQGSSTVQFNGTAATSITSWSNTQIVAILPNNVTAGSGPVTVTVNSIVSNANVILTALNPIITAVTPPAAAINGTITVTGTSFTTWGQVNFNGVAGNVTNWTPTSITVGVPFGATSGPLTVVVSGFASAPVPFTIEGQPAITSLSPTIGPIGSTVTISGSGFGAVQSNSTVDFVGAIATVTSWSDTQIHATVPPGAVTGLVTVTVAGLKASAWFTLNTTVQVTDSAGNVSAYTSMITAGTWHVTDSQGSGCSSCTVRGTTHTDYDASGDGLDSIDELGHQTNYTYDSNFNVTSQSQALNANTNATSSYTYNSFGEVLTATDPLGNVTTNTYDAHGNLLTVTTPKPDANTASSVTQFAYNSLGELTSITDPLSHVTTLTYTSAGMIATITDAQTNLTTYHYDAHGNRTAVIDAMQNETDFAYDTGDRLTTITYPDHSTTSFGYDYRGRKTSVTDQNGKQTTYAYDDADRLVSVTDAANHVTSYGYDDENNLVSITDANGHITNFSYDKFGRVKETDFPSGKAESYIYDAIGNLITKTDRNGNAITYVYDALNRLTHKGYPDSTGVDYIYDLVGKIKQATDPTGTYGFAYDNMGRLIGTTTQYTFLSNQTYSNSYTYDAASNRTGFTAPDGSTNSYTYDSLNRLTTLTSSLTGQFGFGYDALSRRTSLTRPNNVSTSYSYDTLSRLLSVLHQAGSATIDGATYTLDTAGNRTSKVNQLNGITENYTYDPVYQLTQVQQVVNGNTSTTENYTYDAAGSRLSSLNVATYTYNNSNELTSSSDGNAYTYDANGNTLTKANASGTTTYNWDFENRLTGVTLPNGGGVVSFKYNPFGRRIYKSSANGTSVYLYDSHNLIEETDGSGTLVAHYSDGLSTDDSLAMVRSGVTSFYQADGVGSITSISNTAASLAQTYTFNAFGSLTTGSSSLTNPFQYGGRELDSESGLLYLRARYYEPGIGRFISEDPTEFSDGPNFYSYAVNNPILNTDPLGLAHCTVQFAGGTSATLHCDPESPKHSAVDIQVASGNNGDPQHQCKNNNACMKLKNSGPIPPGRWQWTDEPTSKPNGRVLEPLPGTDTFGRDLFRTHSCKNAFGPSTDSPFCSAGCITGSPKAMQKLNKLIDSEPGSTLEVLP